MRNKNTMSVTPETIMLNDTNFMKYWSAGRALCLAVMLLFSLCLPASGEELIVADEETMLSSDYIVDIGPGAGIHGGNIVACGTPEELRKNEGTAELHG